MPYGCKNVRLWLDACDYYFIYHAVTICIKYCSGYFSYLHNIHNYIHYVVCVQLNIIRWAELHSLYCWLTLHNDLLIYIISLSYFAVFLYRSFALNVKVVCCCRQLNSIIIVYMLKLLRILNCMRIMFFCFGYDS